MYMYIYVYMRAQVLDADGSGGVSCDEFVSWWNERWGVDPSDGASRTGSAQSTPGGSAAASTPGGAEGSAAFRKRSRSGPGLHAVAPGFRCGPAPWVPGGLEGLGVRLAPTPSPT